MIQIICNRCGNKVAMNELRVRGTVTYVNARPNSVNHFDFDLCPACWFNYTAEFHHKRSDSE